MAHQGLGTYLLENDRYRMDEGESHLERATQLDPNNALALHNLGIARLLEDKPEEARALLQRAAENAPGVWRYHDSLGRAQLQTNRLKEAAESFEEAILLGPDVGDPYFDLAATKAKQGDIPASVALYQEGLRRDPDWPQRNLALVLNLLGLPNPRFRGKQEVLLSAQQINAATGGSNPMVLLVLAEAQARTDLLRDATKTARRALEVAKEFGNVDLAQRAEWAIKSYEAAPLKR
jgi:tetratricopeptide (TPR) repeat protein